MEAEDDSVLDCNLVSFISFRDSSARFGFAGQFTRTSDFSSLPTVQGRLKLYINFWRSLGTLQFILNVISLGYNIPFCYLPTPFSRLNNASAFSNCLFVSQAVDDLLHANLVEEIFCVPDIVNPLSVSTGNSSKQKLNLDLRQVNSFIFKQKFK